MKITQIGKYADRQLIINTINNKEQRPGKVYLSI